MSNRTLIAFGLTSLLAAGPAVSSARAGETAKPAAPGEAHSHGEKAAVPKGAPAKPAPVPAPAPAPAPARTTAAAAPNGEARLSGEMTCAKCGLHESSKCQNVLRVKDAAGKETRYYFKKNAVSEEQHEKICGGSAKATVTGKVSEEGGKKFLTASAVQFE